MSKRKLATLMPPSSSAALNLYKKSYKGGGKKDVHFAIFQDAQRFVTSAAGESITKVLYPGCHRHLTAALVFPNVAFVDCDKKVAPLYDDPVARAYVETNKVHDDDTHYEFYCYNVNDKMPKVQHDYDLLISLSAGTIAGPCRQYLKTSSPAYLLVNDSHSDARMAFVSGDWELVAYWDDKQGAFTADDLDRCFQVIPPRRKASSSSGKYEQQTTTATTTTTAPMTRAQAQESVDVGTVRKRSFKLLIEPMFFLFRKK